MNYVWILLLFSFLSFEGIQRIALRNKYALQAREAYHQKQYQAAAVLYQKVREYDGDKPSPAVLLNLAHSYFHLRNYAQAKPLYRALLKSSVENSQRSLVATQLAVIEAHEGSYVKALAFSKEAMTADETNRVARYNYELLQKYLILHPEKLKNSLPPPRQPEQGQGGKTSQRQSGSTAEDAGRQTNSLEGSGDTEGGASSSSKNGQNGPDQEQARGDSPGDQPGAGTDPAAFEAGAQGNGQGGNEGGSPEDALLQTRFERLKKIQLSPEKARQLLDAMRQEEAQYLQQLPRRRTKKTDSSRPDW